MKKLALFAASIFAAGLFSFSFASSMLASDTPAGVPLVVKDEISFWRLFTEENEDSRSMEQFKPRIICEGAGFYLDGRVLGYKFESKFPAKFTPLTVEVVPTILRGYFSDNTAEKYTATLVGALRSKAILYTCGDVIKESVNATFWLRLNTKRLGREHFDKLLSSVRTGRPIIIKGLVSDPVVDDRIKGMTRPLFVGMDIIVTLYPTNIDGESLPPPPTKRLR